MDMLQLHNRGVETGAVLSTLKQTKHDATGTVGTNERVNLEEVSAQRSVAQLHALMQKIKAAGEVDVPEAATGVGVDVAVERYLGMAQAVEPPLQDGVLLMHALRLAAEDRLNIRSCVTVDSCIFYNSKYVSRVTLIFLYYKT